MSALKVRRGVVPTIPQANITSQTSITNTPEHAQTRVTDRDSSKFAGQVQRGFPCVVSEARVWLMLKQHLTLQQTAQHGKHVQYSMFAWLIHFLCAYSLLHNGHVVMRGVKGSGPHLIGCSRMTPPWAAISLAHTCPARWRSAAAASLWRMKEDKIKEKFKKQYSENCTVFIYWKLNQY